MPRRILAAATVLAAALALAGCRPEPAPVPAVTTPVSSPTASSASAPAPDTTAQAPSGDQDAACAAAGGVSQLRQPTAGIDGDPSTWRIIGAPVHVCRFEEGEGESATRLYVDPVTLSSDAPTLAALAYLAQLPVPADGPGGLCDVLGGASRYGTTDAPGALVAVDGADDDTVQVCVFADGSFIDTASLAAYSAETVYGTDLSRLFRFDRSDLPDLFADAAG